MWATEGESNLAGGNKPFPIVFKSDIGIKVLKSSSVISSAASSSLECVTAQRAETGDGLCSSAHMSGALTLIPISGNRVLAYWSEAHDTGTLVQRNWTTTTPSHARCTCPWCSFKRSFLGVLTGVEPKSIHLVWVAFLRHDFPLGFFFFWDINGSG